MAYIVAACGSYLFACGKTSNMQLSQNNKYMSLQVIWLDVNWSMADPIYSVSRWLIFFCCCIWHTRHTRNCFSIYIFFFFFAFMLHTEYTTGCFMAKGVVWHNFTSKQDKQFIVLFWTAILFNRLNVNMFFFVCLSVRLQVSFIPLHFRYFGRRFSLRTVDLSTESHCATHSTIFAEKTRNYFSRTLPTTKIKIREK